MASFPPLWRVHGCDPQGIRIRAEDTVVFNALSGQSHVLNTLAGEILLRLLDHPTDRDALAAQLSASLDIPVDDDLRTAIDNALAEMDELGLIACHAQ